MSSELQSLRNGAEGLPENSHHQLSEVIKGYIDQGVPLGAEQIITVPGDEIQPASSKKIEIQIVWIALLVIFLGGLFYWNRRTQTA